MISRFLFYQTLWGLYVEKKFTVELKKTLAFPKTSHKLWSCHRGVDDYANDNKYESNHVACIRFWNICHKSQTYSPRIKTGEDIFQANMADRLCVEQQSTFKVVRRYIGLDP